MADSKSSSKSSNVQLVALVTFTKGKTKTAKGAAFEAPGPLSDPKSEAAQHVAKGRAKAA